MNRTSCTSVLAMCALSVLTGACAPTVTPDDVYRSSDGGTGTLPASRNVRRRADERRLEGHG